jgi:hypothetical protein
MVIIERLGTHKQVFQTILWELLMEMMNFKKTSKGSVRCLLTSTEITKEEPSEPQFMEKPSESTREAETPSDAKTLIRSSGT